MEHRPIIRSMFYYLKFLKKTVKNNKMIVKIVNKSQNPIPKYGTEHSAGMDLMANVNEAITLKPLERKLIPTGVHIELPENTEAQIRPRSGMAIKHGISVLNTPGTIDADYRGEIKVILINLSNENYTINTGDKIAQMVITNYIKVEMEEAETLSDTVRGDGGFGHTGK